MAQVETIGIVYTCTAVATVILTPVALPWVQRRYGLRNSLIIFMACWPTLALLMPVGQWAAVHHRGFMWIVIFLQQIFKCFGIFAMPCVPKLYQRFTPADTVA